MNSDRVRKAARGAVADYLNGRKLNNVLLTCKLEDVQILASSHNSDGWIYMLSVQTPQGVRYFMYSLGTDRVSGELTAFTKAATREYILV